MIGQIQVLDLNDLDVARQAIIAQKGRLIELANRIDPVVVSLHGGAREIEVRILRESPVGPMLVVHLIYDCRDAMGANMVNTACEALAPLVEEITGGRVNLRILSNLADRRLARALCAIPVSSLTTPTMAGTEVAKRIVEAYALAAVDPYRATTHNKGIMNGIDAVLLATGNDWRATEAGAHAYAVREGAYRALSTWAIAEAPSIEGPALIGSIELPLAVGTVGGATRVHPMARASLQILGITQARDLAAVVASVGLAQNLAALRALASEGIQRGHMALHASQIAVAAGAEGPDVDEIARALVTEGKIRAERAAELLSSLRATRQR